MNSTMNFLFVKNNGTTYSEIGAKKVVSLKNPSIESFYTKGNINQLKSLVEGMTCQMNNYRKAKDKDIPVYEFDNECFNQPKMRSQMMPRPHEQEIKAEISALFPSREMQDRIIKTRSAVLLKTLVWWAEQIQQAWKAAFAKEPDFFSANLVLHLK